MTARNTSELLYDAEAALRQVDSAIAELRDAGSAPLENAGACALDPTVVAAHGALGIVDLTHVPARGYGAIMSVLGPSHEGHSVLEHATVDHLRQTHARLRAVTNATGTAARSILAGLERSVAMVDDLDAKAADGDAPGATELRSALRDELFGLMRCVQFQDTTTHQLNYASSVLTEIESRLAELATVLDPATFGNALPMRVRRTIEKPPPDNPGGPGSVNR